MKRMIPVFLLWVGLVQKAGANPALTTLPALQQGNQAFWQSMQQMQATTRAVSGGSSIYMHNEGGDKLMIRVLFLGAAPTQGIHYFPEGTNLLDAILYAGGARQDTNLAAITIRRKGKKELIQYNLEELMERGDKMPVLKDGDVVNFPYNWKRDLATIGLITGFATALTGFTLSIIALSK